MAPLLGLLVLAVLGGLLFQGCILKDQFSVISNFAKSTTLLATCLSSIVASFLGSSITFC